MVQIIRPRIIVTTSHRPSQRLRSFVKDLVTVLPYTVRINRGKSSLRDLYFDAVSLGALRIIIVGMWKGNPGTIRVYEVQEPPNQLKEIAMIRLKGIALTREIPGAKRRRSLATTVAIDVGLLPLPLQHLADTFSRTFFYRIVFDVSEADKHDVIAKAELRNDIIEINFYCNGLKELCGPRLRIIAVEDYVSGFRLHRGRAAFEEFSRRPGQSPQS